MAEAAMEDRVSQNIFDLQIRHLRERADSDEKLSSARFDRLETLMMSRFDKQETILTSFAEKVEQRFNTVENSIKDVRKDIDSLYGHVNKLYDAVGGMQGDIKAINARLDTQQTKFGWYLTIFGLIITVVIAAIQLWK